MQRAERFEDAIETYQKSISLNPTDSDAYNNLGVALQNINKIPEALEAYKRAI